MSKNNGPKKAIATAMPDSAASTRSETRNIIRLMMRFVGEQRSLFILAIIALVIEAAMAVGEAYPLAYLIDFLKADRPPILSSFGYDPFYSPLIDTLAILTVTIVLIAMLNSLADSLAEIYLAKAGRMFGYSVRTALYSQLQRLSLAFHDKQRTGDTLTRVTSDVVVLEEFIIASVSDVLGSVLVLIGTIGVLLYYSWEVSLIAFVVIPIMAYISNSFAQRIKNASKKQRAREGELASSAQEMLTSIRVIQTYGRSSYELDRFRKYSELSVEAALQAANLQAIFSWVVKVLEAVTVGAVVWLGVWLTNMTGLTVGTIVFFIVLIQNMFKPTKKIIKEWNKIGKLYASGERISDLLVRKATVQELPYAVEAPCFRGQIAFRDLSFVYQPDPEDLKAGYKPEVRHALRNIDFDIEPGQVVALVGKTGAGKSTLAQLLPRLYDPTEGQVLIDGWDIRQFTLESLRSEIGVVLQETILFSGTVAENIGYGREDATFEEIVEAATLANVHGFIEQLPEGYNTILGERGTNLSGGQRQRIAIARALIRDVPILILDEPTTGLDADSSEQVLGALHTLMKGKTTIIISHDFKLFQNADKVVVIKDGKIVEMGTPQSLLDEDGVYARLYHKQYTPLDSDEVRTNGKSDAKSYQEGVHELAPIAEETTGV